MATIHDILKEYWGYDRFRPLQEDIINSVLQGHDTLGLLPTGGGKSITFQVPALAMGGLCLVVTPLISLMKDQKDHLVEHGIKAAAIYMGMTHEEILETYERVILQDYRFLYLSPERLGTQLFLAKLQYMKVTMVVVDEAHCISQWGYDFRPAYMSIAQLRQLLPPTVPIMALTATATESVVEDIQRRLHFKPGAQVFKASFERPNLTYSVKKTEDKLGTMVELLQEVPCAIVYVRSRKKTKEVADALCQQGLQALFYHAGLPAAEKQKRQDDWMQGHVPIIVATNAFGMGIDKPNVRLVIHIDLPPSPEEYFQEAGRAGRDRQPARAIILTDRTDKNKLLKHLEEEYPPREYIRMIYGKLAGFYQIAVGAGCNSLFEFEIMKFCAIYKLALTPTHYALKLLDQAGYIIYNEEPDRHSRVMFTTTRDSLYHLNNFDAETQQVMQALLRLYTGLFADYVFIREEDLMRRTMLTREVVYEKLLLLTRCHVLHYVPARQKPAIIYATPRLDNDEIRINHDIYEDRHKRQADRVKAMIGYIDDDATCRLKQLLRYFGEELDHNCGKCDVCLASAAGNTTPAPTAVDATHEKIVRLLVGAESMTISDIAKHLACPHPQTAELLRNMAELEELQISNGICRLLPKKQ